MAQVQGFFSQSFGRCPNIFYRTDGSLYRCAKSVAHSGSHHKYLGDSGIYIQWTDQEAHQSRLDYQAHLIVKSKTPLIGWRAWHISKLPHRLISISAHVTWDGPVMRTKENEAPASFSANMPQLNKTVLSRSVGDPGHYGIYSYKTPKLFYQHLYQMAPYQVFGSISLTGVVIEHELGYRAQIATVKELWVSSTSSFMGVKKLFEAVYSCNVYMIDPNQVKAWAEYYTDMQEHGEYK